MTAQPNPKQGISVPEISLDNFFSAVDARLECWHKLHRATQALASGAGDVAGLESSAATAVKELSALEGYFAYPGPELMDSVEKLLKQKSFPALAQAVQKINNALLTNTYRHDASAWKLDRSGEPVVVEALPPTLGASSPKYRPYFELLIVSAANRSNWHAAREAIHALARPDDRFVCEPVVVGSFEDALLATIFNTSLQAVVLYDGFQFASEHKLPLLREQLSRSIDQKKQIDRSEDLGLALARAIKRIRPELDIYLLSEGNVEQMAASDEASPIKRVFYAVEELLEVHLCIMAGVQERYQTPFFDNLQKYAQRPIGTFHALPIARGKSIFKSNWIRDMGEFYGTNLFLAESSATTGGLDSLLEPTGNIKVAQELAARAFGADRTFFVTNGTSTANKIVGMGILAPGDIVLIDRDCHKSHHYGAVLAGAQPYYIDAFSLREFSMYGSVPIRRIKEALLKLKAEGKLDKAKMLILTNCTFDGHMANTLRTMEECLAIKPDLVFLWDEAWSAFARFSPFLRQRTAMGAVEALRSMLKDPEYKAHYNEFKKEVGEIDLKNPKVLETRLYPDPDKVRLRVYQTNSVHKSMSALRQGSIILVADQEFHTVEASFREAIFAHTSTSPNQQIIASLDLARRQMELEGYELVMRAIQTAVELRVEINKHPLISKYFKAATPEQMIPAEYRKSGIKDYGGADGNWSKALNAIRDDEFFLDPTRITLICGGAGYDGTQFKGILSNDYDIQINKTSRNSILVQININNTRSDVAHILKALADVSRKIESELSSGGEDARKTFQARVKSLMEDVPDLPDFSHFHPAFRDNPKSATVEGHMREAFYAAYDPQKCEHVKLASKEIDDRLAKGPELVSSNFVIPYPPGFPIMVPGQVISKEIITFMRKLDVKEIHGYDAKLGLKLIKVSALEARK